MGLEKINLNIAESISEFELAIRKFLIKRVIYKIIFRGKGLEFDSYRDFTPNDDAADIDWKASVRANKLLIRQYTEERNLNIMFVVDVGDNMVFGSQEKLKCEYVAEMVAALSHLIITSGDRVGFILFSDKIVKTAMPEGGMEQFNLFVDFLSRPQIYGGDSKIGNVLDYLIDYLDESINCVIFVSDFIKLNKNFLDKINLISAKFETIALMVKDPLDISLPDIGREIIIEDPVTKEQMVINPRIARREYEKNAAEKEKIVIDIFKSCNVDFLRLTTDKSFVEPLANFLKERVEKRKYMVAK